MAGKNLAIVVSIPASARPGGPVARLRELAAVKRRYGYRHLHVLLRREGFRVNRKRVVAVLERLVELRGSPQSITVDHGPEFEGQTLDARAYRHEIRLAFIRPGIPLENAYIESFNGKCR